MIKRLYVNNYRCLANFELPISERPSSLLLGRNGTGKSTVGIVLELLQKIAQGTNRISQLVRLSDFSPGGDLVPIRFEIEVTIDGSVYEYILAIVQPNNSRELQVFEEKLSINGTPIFSRYESQIQVTGTNKANNATFGVDWHLVALPIIHTHSTADPLYIFITWLARMLILAPVPSLITGDSEGETLTPKRNVANFGEWFSGLLAYSPATYSHVDKYLKEVMPDFKDVKNPLRGSESRSLAVQFQQDIFSVTFPFRDLSDGEKCYFICAAALAANEAYGPILCFWDEPDNYLALSEIGHFVLALRRAFQNGSQLLVTSHNPEAIRKFSDENTLVMGRRSHLEPATVRMLSDMKVSGDLVDALIRNDVEP